MDDKELQAKINKIADKAINDVYFLTGTMPIGIAKADLIHAIKNNGR